MAGVPIAFSEVLNVSRYWTGNKGATLELVAVYRPTARCAEDLGVARAGGTDGVVHEAPRNKWQKKIRTPSFTSCD